MPYYHIRIKITGKRPPYLYKLDLPKNKLKAILKQAQMDTLLMLNHELMETRDIEDIEIVQTNKESHHYGIGLMKAENIFEKGKNVTTQFIAKPTSLKKIPVVSARPLSSQTPSKSVFIVHGRDVESVKELKSMLAELGLNPIVLHEQPSGSRTIVEKLERYADVGYAFVILTPDDFGFSRSELVGVSQATLTEFVLKSLRNRARQNVVLEFGYFMGKLGRDRVCCLYAGDVELPSDMHGIVYISFEKSVRECCDKIIKELKAAGYKLTIKEVRKSYIAPERAKKRKDLKMPRNGDSELIYCPKCDKKQLHIYRKKIGKWRCNNCGSLNA